MPSESDNPERPKPKRIPRKPASSPKPPSSSEPSPQPKNPDGKFPRPPARIPAAETPPTPDVPPAADDLQATEPAKVPRAPVKAIPSPPKSPPAPQAAKPVESESQQVDKPAQPARVPSAPAHPMAPSASVSASVDETPAAQQTHTAQPAAEPATSPVAAMAASHTSRSETETETILVDNEEEGGSFLFFTAVPSWLTSVIIHVVVLLALTMLSFPEIMREKKKELVIGNSEEAVEELDDFLEESLDSFDVESMDVSEDPIISEALQLPQEQAFDLPTETALAPAAVSVVDPMGMAMSSPETMMERMSVASDSALGGRTTDSKARMIREGGGTKGSEAAVAKALSWIAAHQMPDGGWMLDHTKGACQGRCSHPGTKTARFGATGLALLPFLGAGNTHQDGQYKEVVAGGLRFLLQNMEVLGQRGRLVDAGGNYYSHGLCTIALCEAFAMTKDRELMVPAQLLVNETIYAQDPIGGGWRYKAHQPGDTSAVGWQLMALKSAHMAYLNVPKLTIKKTSMFLDSVQQDDGAKYGYQDPGNRRGTSSVGLLCRMYLGWKRDNKALQAGVDFLGKKGPSKTDIYMNYYATQVMRHYGGEEWERWNKKMRDFLVEEQSVKGHEEGSWMFESGSHHIEAGGRLYCTSLATMILEVYYRHMPLYKTDATDDEFPL